MTRHTSHIILFSLFWFCSIATFGQTDSVIRRLASFVKNSNTFLADYPHEKVYLHLDNTGYYLGETLWFKAYVMTSAFHRLPVPGEVLYVELVAPEGYVVATRKLKIVNGQCHGEFRLDSAFYSGYFEIRAYTRFMLNFGGDGIFSRVFPVFDKPGGGKDYDSKHLRLRKRTAFTENSDDRKKSPSLQMTFFPEGGNLVYGLPSVIAFKAVDGEGADVAVRGEIRDQKGDSVTSFSTVHGGMGDFQLCPEQKKYTAFVHHRGRDYRFALPESLPYGYVMSVNNGAEEHLTVSFRKSRDVLPDTLGLAVVCRGWVSFFDLLLATSDDAAVNQISKKILPAGVNQIIVFDRAGKCLAERKVFISGDSADRIAIRVLNKQDSYGPYERIMLDFEVTDHAARPLATTFSLSVRDSAGVVESYCTDDVLTDLLLSSEVKGFIRDASYYFESSDEVHRHALDLLLLVQGRNRYPWKRISSGRALPVRYPVEETGLVDGVLYHTSFFPKPQGLGHVPLQLKIYTDSLTIQQECETDENGNFRFSLGDLYGKWDMSLKVTDAEKADSSLITLNREFSPDCKYYSYYECHLPDLQFADVVIRNDTALRNVVLGEANPVVSGRIRTFYMPPVRARYDEVLDVIMDKEIPENPDADFYSFWRFTIIPYLLGQHHLPAGTATTVLDDKIIEDSLLTLYGNYCFNVDSIIIYTDLKTRMECRDVQCAWMGLFSYNKLSPLLAARRHLYLGKQLKPSFLDERMDAYTRDKIPDYVVRLTSFPNGRKRLFTPSARHTRWQGYTWPDEFYSPDYSRMPLPAVPDHRRTLYWAPDVQTDASGKASVSFYNHASCSSVRIQAETVTPMGKTGLLKK